MRRLSLLILFGLIAMLTAPCGAGTVLLSGSKSGTTSWFPLRIDGGGFVTAIDLQCDLGVGACSPGVGTTTRVNRTDTAGAGLWNGSQWTQLVTHDSMPAGDNIFPYFQGVCEIRIAPSNTNHLYMYFTVNSNAQPGYVYESLNKGKTWVRTAFPNTQCYPNDQPSPSYRLNWPYMAVDPSNETVVYLGTPSNGVWFTTNGGRGNATTWKQISTGTIPAGSTPAGADVGQGNLVCFDTTSAVVSGKTQGIYITSYGTGIYHTADGGLTWTLLNSAGMPTTFTKIVCDAAGILWVVDNSGNSYGNLWKYTAATWTKVITSVNQQNITSVAIDPVTPSHIFAADYHGNMSISTNTGTSFVGPTPFTNVATTNAWMQAANDPSMSLVGLAFDPSQSNLLLGAAGTGVWSTNPPTTNVNVAWNGDASLGLQNIDATTGVSVPGGPLILQAQDRPTWIITDPTTPQANYYPNYNTEIDPGWGWGAYIKTTPTTIFGMSDVRGVYYSTSNGAAPWVAITAYPSQSQSLGRGQLAIYSNSNAVWAMSNDFGVSCLTGGTLTGTPVWSDCTFTNGATMAGGGWNHNHQYNRNILTFDLVDVSTYYLYNDGSGTNPAGIYKSTNGTSFDLVHAGALDSTVATASYFSMFAVPGNSGHIYAVGMADPETLPNTGRHLWKSTDHGATWTQVPNVYSLVGFSLGKAKPGGSGYPTLFVAGFVSVDGGSTYNFGYWRADDAEQATPTWINIGDGYPVANNDNLKFITGDQNTYGTVYVGFAGSGFAYGKLNFLLGRDLGHVNDNTPVGLNKAA